MNTNLFRKFLLSAIIFTISISANAADKPDPLFGNLMLGNSAEMVYFYAPNTSSTEATGKIMDFSGETITDEGTRLISDLEADSYKMLDVATGDFNGDGVDEVALCMLLPNGSVRTRMYTISGGTGFGWSCFYDNHLGYSPFDGAKDSYNIRIISGNFDADAKAEFAIALWNSVIPGNLHINIIDDAYPGSMRAAEYSGIVIDPGMTDAAKFDIAAGDFSGNGIDEIIVAHGKWQTSSDFRLQAQLFECDLPNDTIYGRGWNSNVYQYNPGGNGTGEGNFIERIALTTGDFDGDMLDEAILGFQYVDGDWFEVGWWCPWSYRAIYYFNLQPLHISPALDTIICNTSNRVQHNTGWIYDPVYPQCVSSPYYVNANGQAMAVAAGDLNLHPGGRDEIAWTYHGHMRLYKCTGIDSELGFEQILDYGISTKYADAGIHTLAIADMDVNPEDSVWLPELILHDWGGSGGTQRLRVFRPTFDTEHNINGLNIIDEASGGFGFYGPVAIATGDFDGDAVRLGWPPLHYVTDSVSQPIVILHSPPVHFDILGDTMDICGCFGDDAASCEFFTSFAQTQSTEYNFQTEIKTDWGVGAKVSCSTGFMGYAVQASFSADYGSNFSKQSGNVFSKTTRDSISTSMCTDWALSSKLTYEIWEYPIYWNGGNDSDHIVIVKPLGDTYTWSPLSYLYDRGITPYHETGNILSYPVFQDSLDLLSLPYVDEVIRVFDARTIAEGGTHNCDITFDSLTQTAITEGWDVDFNVEASVSALSYSVGVNGSYGRGEVCTHSSNVGQAMSMHGQLGSFDSDLYHAPYEIMPCLYINTKGSLVFDFGVKPVIDMIEFTIWQNEYMSLPDLAFIKPRRFSLSSDVQIYTPEIIFTPPRPHIEDTVNIAVKVHNFSLLDLNDDFDIRLYLGDPDAGGSQIIGTLGETSITFPGGIDVRDEVSTQLKWVVPAGTPQESRIYVVIDPENDILEIHENNNKGWNRLFVPDGVIVDVDDELNPNLIPEEFHLHANYPNPFNPITTIGYSLPTRTDVEMTIYNILGRKVTTLVDENRPAGYHLVQWNGTNAKGHEVSSGIYFYRIEAGEYVETKKMLFLK